MDRRWSVCTDAPLNGPTPPPAAQELGLADGLHMEKRLFHSTFATVIAPFTSSFCIRFLASRSLSLPIHFPRSLAPRQHDRKEGMTAFAERRDPMWKDE